MHDSKKEKLQLQIKRLQGNKQNMEIAVSLEGFFDGNNDLGSIGANLADEQPSIETFYNRLKKIKMRKDVQDVLVRIYDAPTKESWAYTDTVYILTSMSKDDLITLINPLKQSEVYENWMYGIPNGAPNLKEGIKPFSIWWD